MKKLLYGVFSIFKLAGVVAIYMIYCKAAPAWMMDPDMGPFLLNKLVIPVGILVPIGSVFLSFLISYGLMEFIGAFVRPIMRAVWKTPGRSAIDAVASFVGSYSIALIITNRVYLGNPCNYFCCNSYYSSYMASLKNAG